MRMDYKRRLLFQREGGWTRRRRAHTYYYYYYCQASHWRIFKFNHCHTQATQREGENEETCIIKPQPMATIMHYLFGRHHWHKDHGILGLYIVVNHPQNVKWERRGFYGHKNYFKMSHKKMRAYKFVWLEMSWYQRDVDHVLFSPPLASSLGISTIQSCRASICEVGKRSP